MLDLFDEFIVLVCLLEWRLTILWASVNGKVSSMNIWTNTSRLLLHCRYTCREKVAGCNRNFQQDVVFWHFCSRKSTKIFYSSTKAYKFASIFMIRRFSHPIADTQICVDHTFQLLRSELMNSDILRQVRDSWRHVTKLEHKFFARAIDCVKCDWLHMIAIDSL